MPLNLKSTSYILAGLAVLLVLKFHLLPAVFAGLIVHVLTIRLARKLPKRGDRGTRQLALACIAAGLIVLLTGLIVAAWGFLTGSSGVAALLNSLAETVRGLRAMLPANLAELLPANLEELREQLAELLKEHGQKLSVAGLEGLKSFALIVLGMVAGGMTTIHHFEAPEKSGPLASALHARIQSMCDAFGRVVLAQLKISAVNTALTALFLLAFLPAMGVVLPLAPLLVLLTFVVGLLPVVGNLVSNTAIVLVGLGAAPWVGIAALTFLVVIHKLEYFLNARIVGNEVHASAWEILCAMLVCEAVFGLAGLVAAPVLYAWLKSECRARALV